MSVAERSRGQCSGYAGLLVMFAWGMLAPATQAWEIDSFETRLNIQSDSTVQVIETIVAEFGTESKHGIYRDIPIHYTDRAGQHFTIRLRVRSVTDRASRPWPYRLEENGRYLRLRIGSPQSTLTGRQIYQIVYDLQRGAIRFFPDHDECYWNMTGNEWAVPIEHAQGRIILPAPAADLRAVAYVGSYGSAMRVPETEIQVFPDRVALKPSRPLAPYEGMTVAVAWGKGLVVPPSMSCG